MENHHGQTQSLRLSVESSVHCLAVARELGILKIPTMPFSKVAGVNCHKRDTPQQQRIPLFNAASRVCYCIRDSCRGGVGKQSVVKRNRPYLLGTAWHKQIQSHT